MSQPKKVLYFAENALSAIQGGGIVAYAVLQGIPADHLLGFFEYRNITPVPEYADRFIYLGQWRTPTLLEFVNRLTRGRTTMACHRIFTELYLRKDLEFVEQQVTRRGFKPEAVYFAGLSYRYLRLAILAAEHYDVPMVLLNMDDWMAVDRAAAGRWGQSWARRIAAALGQASARSLVSTTNSPRLAAKLSEMTGYRHVPANNCCSDLMTLGTDSEGYAANEIPVIAYAGAMNQHLQGETLKVLASAVAELNAEGTRVHLHIYTPWEFAPDANAVSVPDAVFYKGQVGRDRLAEIYRRSDFLVTTVTYRPGNIALFRHSLSTKLSEYLCVGKPVISMGHFDWHLHEYVQDHGCGFSIGMDENFSRAKIKQQLRRILATDRDILARIGESNRRLWIEAHDVSVMAQASRRAIGLPVETIRRAGSSTRRGALWLGDPAGLGWVPARKAKAIARQLVDAFELDAVDLIAACRATHPELDGIVSYCREIGLEPSMGPGPASVDERRAGWDLASIRWSLAHAQVRPDTAMTLAQNVFEQVASLRETPRTVTSSSAQRVINQLSVRVSEFAAIQPRVWFYGSAAVGLEIIAALQCHPWLTTAVEIGGFVSSPGHCAADTLHGYAWRALDSLLLNHSDFIVVTSETSRLSIQEELSRVDRLDRAIPAFGLAASTAIYERQPSGPGQSFVRGSSARDYATRELIARTACVPLSWPSSAPTSETEASPSAAVAA